MTQSCAIACKVVDQYIHVKTFLLHSFPNPFFFCRNAKEKSADDSAARRLPLPVPLLGLWLFFEHHRGWLAHVEDFHGWEVTEMNSDCEDMDPELESDMESDMEIDESEDDMEF